MKISPRLSPPAPRPSPETPTTTCPQGGSASPETPPQGWVAPEKYDSGPSRWDSHAAYQFGWGGTRYLFSKLSTRLAVWLQGGLEGEKSVVLQRPFLAVVGFQGQMSHTRHLVQHLAQNSSNGSGPYYLQGTQVFRDENLTQPLPADWTDARARVFQLVPLTHEQSPEVTAQQLKQAVESVARVTGQPKVDVAAHSMGGLGARIYEAQGGQGVGKLMMVATPNQGIRAATMANWARKSGIAFAMALGGLGPDAGPALDWLQASADGNPRLDELNARWGQDKQRLEKVMVLGATGRTTAQASPEEWGPGDGLVDCNSLPLQDTPLKLLPGNWSQGHISLMNDRQTFREMTDFFEWKAVEA